MIRDIERIYGTLLSRQYQKKLFQDLEGLQEKGDSLIARCPFHEDEHPTFIIYPDRPEYFCFVCGARGDWLGYLQLKTGMDFFGALRLLAGEAGIDPVAYDKNAWDDELSRTILLELMAGFFTTSLYSPAGEGSSSTCTTGDMPWGRLRAPRSASIPATYRPGNTSCLRG